MVDLQEFIVKDIYSKLNIKVASKKEEKNKYKDICYSYLNEKCLFLTDNDELELNKNSSIEEFLISKRKFERNSKWSKFVINNNMKISM